MFTTMLRMLLPTFHVSFVAEAALGLQVVSTGLGIFGSSKAEKKAKETAKHDQQLAKAASEAQIEDILAQKTEAEASAAQRMSDIARQAAVMRARIITSAGEAGVAGGSPAKQLLGAMFQEAEAQGREMYNLQAYKRQANRDIRKAELGYQVNMPRYESTQPGFLSQLVAGSLDVLKIYSSMKT